MSRMHDQPRALVAAPDRHRHRRRTAVATSASAVRRRAAVAVAVLAGLCTATIAPVAAQAAFRPLELGAGQLAAVDVDSAGTAYIAWVGNEPLGSTLQFCRLPLGASKCDLRSALPAPGESVTRPFVMVDGSTVRVAQYRYGLADGLTPDRFAAVYLFTSGDRGGSFDAGAQIGTVPFTDAVRGPGGAISLATNAVTQGAFYQRVPVDGAAPVTAAANLSADHLYNGTVGLLDGAPLTVFTDATGRAQFRRFGGAGDPNDAATWTPAQDIGQADWPHVAGGPAGMFLLDTRGDGQIEVRRFAGDTFASGVAVPDGRGETPQDYLAQDPGGLLHVLLPQITASCCPLLYAYSDGGRKWGTISYPLKSLATQVRATFGANHRGVAVWHAGTGSDAKVFAVRLGPKVTLSFPPGAARMRGRLVVDVGGKLQVPAGVVPRDVCEGRVTATVKRGATRLASRAMKVRSTCAFGASVALPAQKLGSARTVSVTLRFSGNRVAHPSTRTYTLKLD